MNNLEKIAEMLGVKLGENFTICTDKIDPYDFYTEVHDLLNENGKILARFGTDWVYCYSNKYQDWCDSPCVLRALLTGELYIEGQECKNRMSEVAEMFGFKFNEEFEADFAGKTDVLFFTSNGVKKYLNGSPATDYRPMIQFIDISDDAFKRLLNGKYENIRRSN